MGLLRESKYVFYVFLSKNKYVFYVFLSYIKGLCLFCQTTQLAEN